jgi:hypothetical protein
MLADISQYQAGIGEKLRVYTEQFTRLAKPLFPAPQETFHCLVSLPDPVKHYPRRNLAVRLCEIACRAGYLLNRIIGCVSARNPGHHIPDAFRMGAWPGIVDLSA